MLNEEAGRIIQVTRENVPVAGCTVSKQVYWENGYGISYFSLASNTSISAECYSYPKLCMVHGGVMEVFDIQGHSWRLSEHDCIIFPQDKPIGVRSCEGCVYTEVSFRKESHMNDMIKSGEVFKLGELLPYQEGKIINMDIVNEDKMKFVIMSFDAGTGLSEHAAPGEALVFALDGEAVIGYEGKEYPIKAGETFKFDKLGKHSVRATSKFKMALMLVFD